MGEAAFIEQAQRLGAELGMEVRAGPPTKAASARKRSERIEERRQAVIAARQKLIRSSHRALWELLHKDDPAWLRSEPLDRLANYPGELEEIAQRRALGKGSETGANTRVDLPWDESYNGPRRRPVPAHSEQGREQANAKDVSERSIARRETDDLAKQQEPPPTIWPQNDRAR